ncbi:MAG: peptide deformylase, partial [Candidatus Poseidoniaceae archaeon]
AMKGIGLSANQCGLPIRAFVMYTDLQDGNIQMYINPKIIWQSEEKDFFLEGCLTYPHLFLNIKRPKLVEFEYMDMEGNQQKGKFSGLTARIFQHEYDHMDGKNFTMLASKLKLDMARKKQAKKLKKVLKTS